MAKDFIQDEEQQDKATDKIRGISIDQGADHPAKCGHVMGKYSKVTGGWLAQAVKGTASILAPGREDESPGMDVEGSGEEIRAIRGVSGQRHQLLRRQQPVYPSHVLMGLEQGCGKGLPGRPPAPSAWLGPCQPPVPPPGMGRSASPRGGRGWRGEGERGQPPG